MIFEKIHMELETLHIPTVNDLHISILSSAVLGEMLSEIFNQLILINVDILQK